MPEASLQPGHTIRLSALNSTVASQLVEFAVALPLLVVLLVGIFDFGDAFNVKHQLGHAVRDGARFAASLPMSDIAITSATPASVIGAWQVVDGSLLQSRIQDCGLGSPTLTPSQSGTTYKWTYSPSPSTCVGTLNLIIERAYAVPPGASGPYIICSKVSITYPYPWHFNRLIQLLVPGSTYGATLQVAADATMPNME